MKVLLLTNVPSPYNLPAFRQVHQDAGWSLTVCYASSENKDVGWRADRLKHQGGYESLVLDVKRPRLKRVLGASIAAALALRERLNQWKPEYVIVYGYSRIPQLTAIAWSIGTATPFAVLGDSNIYADCARGIKRSAKRRWLRYLVHKAAAIMVVGTANRRFWESYGAPACKLFDVPFAVDNEHFARTQTERSSEATALSRRMGIAGKTIFIYVGRLIQSKNVDLLIRAGMQLSDANVGVLIIGEGPERRVLETLARGASNIVFLGQVANKDLPSYYALAHALVLPSSREPWGLVVNEAMAAGLAIIAHRHCGAVVDLVNAENGALLESFSVEELAAAMLSIAGSQERRQQMQMRSLQKIGQWSIEAFAHGIVRAVQSTAMQPKSPSFGQSQGWAAPEGTDIRAGK